jgi:arylsulfatase A
MIRVVLLYFLFLLISVKASEKPNILFILIDDLGWKDLACQDNPHLHTPNIDRLAEQGMRFTDAYAAAPVCSPTRAAILTGQSPARLWITNHLPHQDRFTPDGSKLTPAKMLSHLPLEKVTIAERLRDEAGYATGFFGKWHVYSGNEDQYGPLAQGFDVNVGGNSFGGPPSFFDPYKNPFIQDRKAGEYLPDRLADETIQFMRKEHKAGKPFFAALFNYTVHWPMEAPDALIKKYAGRPKEGYRDHRYAAMIEAMDAAMGRVFAALDEMGIAEETLLIFTSDNGPFGGVGDCRPLRGDKGHLYEGGIRVPMIVRWPGKIKEGAESAEPVISTDFFATLLDAGGLKPDANFAADGESLLPLLKGKGKPKRDAIYWHYPNFSFHKDNRLGSAIRKGKYKLIRFFDDESTELYDLTQDIGETKNLVKELPDVATQMHGMLVKWLKESGAQLPIERQ